MKVQDIEAAIEELSPNEMGQLAVWFEEHLQAYWDRQLDADAAVGGLDVLYEHLVGGDGSEGRVSLDDFLDDKELS